MLYFNYRHTISFMLLAHMVHVNACMNAMNACVHECNECMRTTILKPFHSNA